jgi:CheY-like chemotaxis protein
VGTSFTLYFPAVKVKRALLGDTTHAQVRGGNETILVVDDEEPVRIVSQDILSTLGYRVILARDGEAAVRIFQERPHAIDLVLMDIAMPNLNGRSAAKAMRLAQPDLKILFTSGYTDKAQVETLGQDGFPHFLAKPYSMLDLQSAVRRTLDGESEKA